MPKFLELKTEVDITRLSKVNYSCRQIKKKLNEEDIDVSISTICRVLNNIGIRRQALNAGEKTPKFQRKPIKRIDGVIKKVKTMVCKENPATYRAIQKQTSLSPPTISKIIHHDLHLKNKSS